MNYDIGIIGLGAMGSALVYRWVNAGFRVLGFDPSPSARSHAQQLGATVTDDKIIVAQQCAVIWMMVPAGAPVDETINALQEQVSAGTIIIDGGNSNFHDSIRHAQELAQHAIIFLDCGTSGGLAGKEHGFCLMVGGERTAYDQVLPLLRAAAAPDGVLHVGGSGAGHYVKMVHNGIEYGLLQAYAEGAQLMLAQNRFNLDVAAITELWGHGSIIRSYILELLHKVLQETPDRSAISGIVDYTGMGEWTVAEGQAQHIPLTLIETALNIRKESQQNGGTETTKLVALLRHAFGGHKIHGRE